MHIWLSLHFISYNMVSLCVTEACSFHSCLPATRVCPHIRYGVSCWASEGGVVSSWDHTGDSRGATWTWCQRLLPYQREWDQTLLLLTVTKTPKRCCTLPCSEKRFWPLWSSWNSQGLYDSSQPDWPLQTPSHLRGSTPPAHLSLLKSHPCWWVEVETLHMASIHITSSKQWFETHLLPSQWRTCPL